jgi:uncharacterized integral membrane protein
MDEGANRPPTSGESSGTPAQQPPKPIPPRGDAPASRTTGPERAIGADLQEDRDHLRQLQRARQGRVVKLLVVLAILIIFTLFVIQNSQPTQVDFVFFNRQPRLIWVMLACGVLGGIIGYLIGRPGKQARLHRRKDREPKR